MKVYVLETGQYDDAAPVGVYGSLEKAQAAWQPPLRPGLDGRCTNTWAPSGWADGVWLLDAFGDNYATVTAFDLDAPPTRTPVR